MHMIMGGLRMDDKDEFSYVPIEETYFYRDESEILEDESFLRWQHQYNKEMDYAIRNEYISVDDHGNLIVTEETK